MFDFIYSLKHDCWETGLIPVIDTELKSGMCGQGIAPDIGLLLIPHQIDQFQMYQS